MIKKISLAAAVLFCCINVYAQVPANPQTKSVLIIGATAHIGNGTLIENSAIGFKNGKLTVVDKASAVSKADYEEVIEAKGKHIYPGFIAPNIRVGLMEIGAVRSTLDYDEVGSLNPNARAIIAYNTDSKIIPTVRTNGVLLAQVTPKGGVISGSSSVVKLDGWNWEDAVYKMDDGIHMNWPRMAAPSYWTEDGPGPAEKNKNYDKQVYELKNFFSDSRAYNLQKDADEVNLRFAALKGIFEGRQNLYIHTNYVKEMMAAIDFAKSMGIAKLVLVGANDAWMIADQLKQNKISIVIGKVHELPQRVDEDVDQPYKLPALLHKAGVLYCLSYEGEMEVMGSRNLPFQAGTAAAYGIDKEAALSGITLNAAKILGVDKTTGSLETGKDATLFISTGDALDMRTNNVEKAFIIGSSIDLNNSQTELYEKFSKKYNLK